MLTREQELSRAAREGDWEAYFRALGGRQKKAKRADLELPEAEHTSRQEWPEGFAVPTGAARVKKAAESAGWEARVQYGRGFRWGVGTAVNHVHSVALLLRHPEGRFGIVVYEAKVGGKLSWKADAAWYWEAGGYPRKLETLTELTSRLSPVADSQSESTLVA